MLLTVFGGRADRYGLPRRAHADSADLATIDLFKDFGERTLSGIAFTIHGGPGYFDHVYLGRGIEDLDRIDVGLGGQQVKLDGMQFDRLWHELAAADAAVQYRAFWTFVAGRQRRRIETLLAGRPQNAETRVRREKAQRVLAFIAERASEKR